MLRIALVRPGSTDFEEQGRIMGTLDIPLNEHGATQVAQAVHDLAQLKIDAVYASPNGSAQQTALAIAGSQGIRVKTLDNLQNLDHGLWHGKLIEEVKQTQPRVYRQWQDHPETVCPPEGESVSEAKQRVTTALRKLMKKHASGVVALVVPEPLASLVRCYLADDRLGDLWKAECDCGRWELIDIDPSRAVSTH
jgi:phosphoserine phosphatase